MTNITIFTLSNLQTLILSFYTLNKISLDEYKWTLFRVCVDIVDPGGEGRWWLRRQKENKQVPLVVLQSAGAPTCQPFQTILGYSRICRDLIALLLVRGYATPQWLSKTARGNGCRHRVPSQELFLCWSPRLLLNLAFLFLCRKHSKCQTDQRKSQVRFSDVFTNSIISIYLVWEPTVVRLTG